MPAIIYYHANCPDGLTAAAVTRRFCMQQHRMVKDHVFCIPLHHGKAPEIPENLPAELKGIYFVDICPNPDQLDAALSGLGQETPVMILDHHISAHETGEQMSHDYANVDFIFDNNQSGASVCFQYLFGLLLGYGDEAVMPDVVMDVRDIDLWHWQRPDSYGMTTLIGQKNDIDVIDELLNPEGYARLLPTARALSDFHQEMAQKQAKASMLADVIIIDGDTTLWKSPGRIPVLATDGMTGSLAINRAISRHLDKTQCDIGIGFYTAMDSDSQEASIKLSVRSNGEDATLDVTQPLGGGGHRNASGAKASRIEILADENRVIFHA